MQINEQIISLLDSLCDKFGLAVDWSQQNILPYLQDFMGRYIRYEIATSVVWSAIFIVVTFALFKGAMLSTQKASKVDWDPNYPCSVIAVVAWILLGLCVVTGVLVIISQIFDIVECLTLPEKRIINLLSSLSK